MSRRGFIAGLAALAVALFLALSPTSPLPFAWVARLPGRRRWLAERLRMALDGLWPDAYLPTPEGADPLLAAASLVAGLSRREVEHLLDDGPALRAHVDLLRESDFQAGRTRFAEGWLLAETELHVAALLVGEAPA